MSASNLSVAPVQQTERIQIVDILRGFALFGILFVNMTIFSRPIQAILFPVDPRPCPGLTAPPNGRFTF